MRLKAQYAHTRLEVGWTAQLEHFAVPECLRSRRLTNGMNLSRNSGVFHQCQWCLVSVEGSLASVSMCIVLSSVLRKQLQLSRIEALDE
jgi:hypothetical protein